MEDKTIQISSVRDLATANAEEVAELNAQVIETTNRIVGATRELTLLNSSLNDMKKELDEYDAARQAARNKMQNILKKL